jgi:predicted  nucleic acid-binding Zn-ribbon protein
MNSFQLLYRLQQLELSLDNAKKRLDEIVAERVESPVLRQARLALEECRTQQRHAEARLTDLELELGGLMQKSAEAEEYARGHKARKQSWREQNERSNELDSLKKRITSLQRDLQSAKTSLQQAEADIATAQGSLREAEVLHLDHKQSLDREESALQRDITRTLQERKFLLERVNPEQYKIYKKLKPQRNGIAVARLEENACSICRVEQTQVTVQQVRQAQDLVYCKNCSRILVDAF